MDLGDRPYLVDALSRASRSVYRVEIVDRICRQGVKLYLVRPLDRSLDGRSPRWLAAEDLAPEPVAHRLSPADRRRWKTNQSGPSGRRVKRTPL